MRRPLTNALTLGYLLQPHEPPAGMVTVPAGKGCVLLLTREEYVNGVKRGKRWRREVARTQRGRYPIMEK